MTAAELDAMRTWCEQRGIDAGEVEARRLLWTSEGHQEILLPRDFAWAGKPCIEAFLWSATTDAERQGLVAWCSPRGLDAAAVEDRRLVWVADHQPDRLTVFAEVYSEHGNEMADCMILWDGRERTIAPAGRVLADPLGRLLLNGQPLGDRSAPDDHVRRAGIWLVEDALEWLRAATEWSDADEDAPAILGLFGPQSWSRMLAARIPDGTTVTLLTSAETERRIVATLAKRMIARRVAVQRVVRAIHREETA